MAENRNLPTIQDLYTEVELREKENALAVILNSPPKVDWLKKHPMAKKKNAQGESVSAEYLPIERVEYLLTRIFINWRVEIKEAKLIGNSGVVTVRLHYKNPITNEWDWQDGIGASPLQTDSGAGAVEFDKLKSGAVQMAMPSAESYAVKDAAAKLGRLFGKDVNRREVMDYDGLAGKFDTKEKAVKETKKKLLDGLDKYTGKDKEEIREECQKREASNGWDEEFINSLAKRLKVTL
jgi:hypothetical protein